MELGAGWALAGRTGRAAGAGVGRRGRQQGAGRWTQARVAGVRTGAGVRQALGVRGRARGAARQGARARGQLGGRRARGRAAGVGARGAGRGLGWPWAVHSVHSAHFRSVLTRFFFFLSHQMNTVHCKVKCFQKKKIIFIKFK